MALSAQMQAALYYSRKKNRLRRPSIGLQLFTGFDSFGSGWADDGDGTYSCDGTQVANTVISETVTGSTFEIGKSYFMTIPVKLLSAGIINSVQFAGVTTAVSISSVNKHTIVHVATSVDGNIVVQGSSSLVVEIDSLSVRELVT